MAHFEAYISHMDMENYNETHSLTTKNELEHSKPAL